MSIGQPAAPPANRMPSDARVASGERENAQGRRRLRALGAAVGDAIASGTDRVEEMHRGIAARAFSSTGPGAVPARVVHDAVAARSYAVVRSGLRTAGRLGGIAASVSPLANSPRITGRQAGLVEGAVNGLWGDRLEARHPDLAVPMALRSAGCDIAVRRDVLAETYPAAGRSVAVFLHGLCETEDAWGRPAQGDDQPGTYGDRLRRHLRLSPVFLRYNTGLHVSDNGERLASLLEQLLDEWPVPVEDLALIGHSMGGLVMRSACHIGLRHRMRWIQRVRHCVYLGTPHDGAPLERGANMLAGTLRVLPETRAMASLIDVRSAGIKDLRFGYLRREDWEDADLDARMVDTGSHVPLLSTARHHVVAATLGHTPHHVLSRLFGDLLVLYESATGRGHRGISLDIDEAHRRHLGGITHFRLLDHPAVADLLREWLTEPIGARA